MKATNYHLRDQNGAKVLGGSLDCATLEEGAAHLATRLDVVVMPSGYPVFTYHDKPVWAYLTVHPGETDKGRNALRQAEEARKLEHLKHKAKIDAIGDLTEKLGLDEALALLQAAARLKP